jgi:hypothetical protein
MVCLGAQDLLLKHPAPEEILQQEAWGEQNPDFLVLLEPFVPEEGLGGDIAWEDFDQIDAQVNALQVNALQVNALQVNAHIQAGIDQANDWLGQ